MTTLCPTLSEANTAFNAKMALALAALVVGAAAVGGGLWAAGVFAPSLPVASPYVLTAELAPGGGTLSGNAPDEQTAGALRTADVRADYIERIVGDVKLATSGAGAAGIACLDMLVALGLKPENILAFDRDGVIYTGRPGLDPDKARYASDTGKRTLLVGSVMLATLTLNTANAAARIPRIRMGRYTLPIAIDSFRSAQS